MSKLRNISRLTVPIINYHLEFGDGESLQNVYKYWDMGMYLEWLEYWKQEFISNKEWENAAAYKLESKFITEMLGEDYRQK
jgi:hypothetical protein